MHFDINGLFIVTWSRVSNLNDHWTTEEDGKLVPSGETEEDFKNLIL